MNRRFSDCKNTPCRLIGLSLWLWWPTLMAFSAWSCSPAELFCIGPDGMEMACGPGQTPRQPDTADSAGPTQPGADGGIIPGIEDPQGRPDVRPEDAEYIMEPGDCPQLPFGRPPGTPSGGAGGEPDVTDQTINLSGALRNYRVAVPSCHQEGRLYGLAVVLHDTDGDRDYLRFKWVEPGQLFGYITVYPEARRTIRRDFNWNDELDENITFLVALVDRLQDQYNIDRSDTLITGLGSGASFAGRVVLDERARPLFQSMLIVNGSFMDPEFLNILSVFMVDGRQDISDHPQVQQWLTNPNFQFEYVPNLGPYYPGRACPQLSGDPEVLSPSPMTAIPHFWGIRN